MAHPSTMSNILSCCFLSYIESTALAALGVTMMTGTCGKHGSDVQMKDDAHSVSLIHTFHLNWPSLTSILLRMARATEPSVEPGLLLAMLVVGTTTRSMDRWATYLWVHHGGGAKMVVGEIWGIGMLHIISSPVQYIRETLTSASHPGGRMNPSPKQEGRRGAEGCLRGSPCHLPCTSNPHLPASTSHHTTS